MHPLALGGALLALTACASPREFEPFPARIEMGAAAAIESHWVGDLAFVPVSFGGSPPRRFLLDTGASGLLIDPSVVTEEGLDQLPLNKGQGGYTLGGADGSSTQVYRIARIPHLHCGPLDAYNFDAMLLDLDPLRKVMGVSFDGILPFTMFRDGVLTIDYPEQAVEIAPAQPSDLPLGPHGMQLAVNRLPHIQIPFDGKPLTVLLDSGSSGFLSIPKSRNPRLQGPEAEIGRQQTIGGTLPLTAARLADSLVIGGHTLEQPVATLGREDRGAIGGELLRHFRVEFDQPNRRVRFLTDQPIPCAPVRSPGFGAFRGGDVWTVAYVLEGTPAAALGLKVGDRIAKVNGEPTQAWPPDRTRELYRQQDAITLTLKRGESTRNLLCGIKTLVP